MCSLDRVECWPIAVRQEGDCFVILAVLLDACDSDLGKVSRQDSQGIVYKISSCVKEGKVVGSLCFDLVVYRGTSVIVNFLLLAWAYLWTQRPT